MRRGNCVFCKHLAREMRKPDGIFTQYPEILFTAQSLRGAIVTMATCGRLFPNGIPVGGAHEHEHYLQPTTVQLEALCRAFAITDRIDEYFFLGETGPSITVELRFNRSGTGPKGSHFVLKAGVSRHGVAPFRCTKNVVS
ncbi:MAG TPA: hypothetical protein VJH94_02710 [Candidatus Paceibacterota bacterium]